MSDPRKVLIVEDDGDIRELVRFNLEQEGFEVLEAADGEAGLEAGRHSRPGLIILDLMLPGTNGLEVCRLLRSDQDTAFIPILMLTARSTEIDKVVGLEMGADDYVTKPFSPRELLARIRALLRRTYGGADREPPREIYERGWLRIDVGNYETFLGGVKIPLSLREFELLRFFVQSPDRVYSRLEILDLVWGEDTNVEPRTVDVHIRRLRQHLERDDSKPELIQTVRGVGYGFSPAALDEPRARPGKRR